VTIALLAALTALSVCLIWGRLAYPPAAVEAVAPTPALALPAPAAPLPAPAAPLPAPAAPALCYPPATHPLPPFSDRQLEYVRQFADDATATAVLMAVHRVSAERGLDPRVVLAIIKPESTFDPKARSRGGDFGLMQIRVRYHHDRIQRLGVTDILDIESNIRVGADIVVEYRRHAKGNLLKALTRYTGGSRERARRILQLAKQLPV
jgi:soluble lytic murein transglycosylase-like protein